MQIVSKALRWTLIGIVALFFHYVLPQHDVARVSGMSDRILTLSGVQRLFYAQTDAGETEGAIRDLRLINSEKVNTWALGFWPRNGTDVMVYRNEDTGWIWPPYFKFDSSNLEAEAQQFSLDQDQWVQVTHYGWRIPFLSIYPNAISIKPVDGPDYYPIPWFSIIFFGFLAFAIGMIRAMWRQFRERSVDPLLDAAGDEIDELKAGVSERQSGVNRWLNTWRAKDKRR